MRLFKLLLTLSIIFTGFFGDYIVFSSKISNSLLFKAVADNTVHGFIGFLSACLFFSHHLNIPLETRIYYTLLCTMMSSFIDIDHVFVAKSFYLKDLTNLKQRGIFHCTTFWLFITIILLTYSYIVKKLNINILSYMLILAFTSHHIRDGNRRGIWIYPYGHTAAINKFTYLLLSALLPHVFAYTFVLMKPVFNIKDYSLIETV